MVAASSARSYSSVDDAQMSSDTNSTVEPMEPAVEEATSLRSRARSSRGAAAGGAGGSAHERKWRTDVGLTFDDALCQERQHIEENLRKRGAGGVPEGAPFSVAFSGGGVRAAAFQAGVLWRLAQAGRLRNVEHFVAVSGGAYVASSFASHVVKGEAPESEGELDAWYREIVARTLCRMQRNIGYFIRDWANGPLTVPKDGSGPLPPIADVPVLLAVTLFTLLSNPLTHFVVYIIPLTECVNEYMGLAMRAAYCAPSENEAWTVFEWWGPLHTWLGGILCLLSLTFFAWIIGKLPCCRLQRDAPQSKSGRCLRRGSLCLQSLGAALTRILVISSVILFILCGILSTERWHGSPLTLGMQNQTREEVCAYYVRSGGRHPMANEDDQPGCDDMRRDQDGQWVAWWEHPMFDKYRDDSGALLPRGSNVTFDTPGERYYPKAYNQETWLLRLLTWPFQQRLIWSSSIFVSMILLLLAVLGVALLLMPIFKGLFVFCMSLVGPTVAVFVAASFMQYRIFGPLTGQYYLPLLQLWPFQRADYLDFRLASLVLAFVLMIFFHGIHFASHYFYARSLRKAYFADGSDLSWQELRENKYCPHLVFTGTVTDWRRPGEEEKITEISISSLHTGSARTGFVATPPGRSVAKCTALAAAATDALILGMMDRLRNRFWLEFLNVRMGDYILFERFGNPCVDWFKDRIKACRRESFFIYEFPVVACGGLAFLGFIAASLLSHSGVDEATCGSANSLYKFSIYTSVLLFFLSFFGFVPVLEFFVHSPMIRQLHMAMGYYHVSETPPSMMYISDGGVQDCTGVLQLMRRQCSRILLALAADDPHDDLRVLRETIRIAIKLKVGSFYDPKDPRRDVSMLLDEFKQEPNRTYLHLGIRYNWNSSEVGQPQRKTGHLIIVKNRLPSESEQNLIEPPLSEAEIAQKPDPCGMSMSSIDERCSSCGFSIWSPESQMKQVQLGGCCCDCCHVLGCNLGPKFPHTSIVNQFLTPALFTHLCRLGYRISQEAVEVITKIESLEESWESNVA